MKSIPLDEAVIRHFYPAEFLEEMGGLSGSVLGLGELSVRGCGNYFSVSFDVRSMEKIFGKYEIVFFENQASHFEYRGKHPVSPGNVLLRFHRFPPEGELEKYEGLIYCPVGEFSRYDGWKVSFPGFDDLSNERIFVTLEGVEVKNNCMPSPYQDKLHPVA
ncbi:hypothetical protein HYU11_06135 [Candidatus Woesearchaeota archaeon]|nr:hypothetical protein [Candidatus Woesearchaeota archaeon]